MFSFPCGHAADGEKRQIMISMDEMQESSASGVAFTGGVQDKAATGTPGELDEAFTISVHQILLCI